MLNKCPGAEIDLLFLAGTERQRYNDSPDAVDGERTAAFYSPAALPFRTFLQMNPSRRQVVVSLSAAWIAGSVVRRPVLAATRRAAGRLNVGFIGTGNQGIGLLKRFLQWDLGDVVAVCDVNEGSYGYREPDHFYGRKPAAELVNATVAKARDRGSWKGCEAYLDYRELISRDDIDAVVIVVPDHQHAVISIAAAEAGKQIYCEKPMSLTVADGRAMVDAVQRTGVTFQTGSHERSRPESQFVCESVLDGAIGQVTSVETVVGFNNKVGPGPGWKPQPVPPGFDYQRWLGPAPQVPYHSDRCLYRFRFNYDYCGGQISNFGAHSCDMAHWGLGKDTEMPKSIRCNHAEFLPAGSLFNTATVTDFTADYADGVTMRCVSSEPSVQVKFIGTDGWMLTGYGGTEASRPELLAGLPGPTPKDQMDAHSRHLHNFVEAIAGRATLAAPVRVGHNSANIGHAANTVIRRFPKHGNQSLTWNAREETLLDPQGKVALVG